MNKGEKKSGNVITPSADTDRPQLIAHRLQKREVQRRLDKIDELHQRLRDLRQQMVHTYSIFQETMDEIEREIRSIEEGKTPDLN